MIAVKEKKSSNKTSKKDMCCICNENKVNSVLYRCLIYFLLIILFNIFISCKHNSTHNVSTFFFIDVDTCVHASTVPMSCNGKVENVQYAKFQ